MKFDDFLFINKVDKKQIRRIVFLDSVVLFRRQIMKILLVGPMAGEVYARMTRREASDVILADSWDQVGPLLAQEKVRMVVGDYCKGIMGPLSAGEFCGRIVITNKAVLPLMPGIVRACLGAIPDHRPAHW